MKFEILTLFPEMFAPVLGSSILKRAEANGRVCFRVRNIRDFATDKHHVTDDTPYGGGPGMVMKPEPIAAAFAQIAADNPGVNFTRIYLSPQGEKWTQRMAEQFSAFEGIVLLCGHYEGVDERVRERFIDREVSIGDFVLTGGELAAMVLVDSVARLIPGVLGNDQSAEQESFSSDGLLDHPHYTRPEEFQGMRVPDVLLSGHHKKIEEWRRLEALKRTMERRPDLIEENRDSLSCKERELLDLLRREGRAR